MNLANPNFLKPAEICPICGSVRISHAFDMNYWRENRISFFDCKDCGLSFANPMPSEILIEKGNQALVNLYGRGREFKDDFRDARQSYLRGKILAKRLSGWKKRGKLLELGCYNGFFSLGFKENSEWQVEGLEISEKLARFVADKLNIPCHAGILEERELRGNEYDFIVCHDLIEHIIRPERFLNQIARILRPGGRLQIITPNGTQDLAYARRVYASNQIQTILLNHVLMFSPKALRTALEKIGFKIKNLHCYDIRYALKDFGWISGQPKNISQGESMNAYLSENPLGSENLLSGWTEEKFKELRNHPKTKWVYGIFKEILPNLFTLRVPENIGVGHEIYALAEKPHGGVVDADL